MPGGWTDSTWVTGSLPTGDPNPGKWDVLFTNWSAFGGGTAQTFMACTVNETTATVGPNRTNVGSSLSKSSQAARSNVLFAPPRNPYVFDLAELEGEDTLRLTSQRWLKPNDTITLTLSCPGDLVPHRYDAAVGFYGTRKQALTHAPKVQIKETPLLRPNRGVRFTAKAGDIPERKLGFQTKVVCIRD
jgi:hypothetical protein